MNRFRFTIIVIILAISALGFKCGGSNDPNAPQRGTLIYNTDRPNPSGDDCLYDAASYHQTTGGVTVRSCVDVPQTALDAIDRGISHQIRNSSHYNPDWTGFRNLSDYQVFLRPPMTHNVETVPGSPALLVNMVDAGGVVEHIQSAGTCIGVGGSIFRYGQGPADDPRYPSIVLPEQSAENWQYLDYFEESARNETEHIAEWANNKQMFYTNAIVGDVHPHFPDWTETTAAPKKAPAKPKRAK